MKAILVLDDDAKFRQLVVQLFEPRGFKVLEARSPSEANALLHPDVCLAIVDRRLGSTDGMAWIEQLRAAKNRLPVVFVSGTWCDGKTFQLLRNVLNVSLVLKKPIVPTLFVQQIEALLPSNRPAGQSLAESHLDRVDNYMQSTGTMLTPTIDARLGYDEIAVNNDVPNLPAIASMPGAQLQQVPLPTEVSDPSNMDPTSEEARAETLDSLLEQTRRLNRRLQVQKKMQEAQQTYSLELARDWRHLQHLIEEGTIPGADPASQSAARELAHKIRGTAGTFGFARISEIAARLEDSLQSVELNSEENTQPLVAEVFKLLKSGQGSIDEVLRVPQPGGGATAAKLYNLLVIGGGSTEEMVNQVNAQTEIEATLVDSIAVGITRAERERFDAVLIDDALLKHDRESLSDLCYRIRSISGNEDIPFALLTAKPSALNVAELNYAGVSHVFDFGKLPAANEITNIMLGMVRGQIKDRLKVLVVDDDPALCQYLIQVLTDHQYNVQALNEPIEALNVLNEFQPDIVMLDVNMPGLSGYDVCREMREHSRWAKTPVIFLTARANAESRISAFQAGGTDYLTKPVISQEVVSRINSEAQKLQKQHRYDQTDSVGVMLSWTFVSRANKILKREETSKRAALAVVRLANYDALLEQHGAEVVQPIMRRLALSLRNSFKKEYLRGHINDDSIALFILGEDDCSHAPQMMALFDREAAERMHDSTDEDISLQLYTRVQELALNATHPFEQAIVAIRTPTAKAQAALSKSSAKGN